LATYSPSSLGISAPSGGFQTGGWYQGRQYWNGTLSDPGVIHPQSNQQGAGQAVSQETVQQTNPDNWQYIQSQQVSANQIQAPANISLPSESTNETMINSISGAVAQASRQAQEILAKQSEEQQKKSAEAKATQTVALESYKGIAEGIQKDIETFADPQIEKMVEDLDTARNVTGRLEELLTEGQELIRQQKEVTGLASIRNPRINKTIEDVASEAGVLQGVLSALRGNIADAQSIINTKMNVVMTARSETLNYYKLVIDLSEKDIVRLDNDAKRIAEAEIANSQKFLDNALDVQKTIQEYMADPAKASLMQGVRLNMSIEEINQTIANNDYNQQLAELKSEVTTSGGTMVLDPTSIPADQLRSFTDSRGQVHYYKIAKSGSGSFNTDSYRDSFKETTTTTQQQSSQAPNFTPSGGMGSEWVDPVTGAVWKFESTGWRRIL